LISRLWDLNPAVFGQVHARILAETDADFGQLLQARRALALDDEPNATPSRPAKCLEEELEALRIRLGQACLRRDEIGLNDRIGRSLFRLLPKADRLFWSAMQQRLRGSMTDARHTFEAAADLGHRRAAWAMSVLCAEEGNTAQAASWSRKGLGNRSDEHSELWRRWLDAASGNSAAQDTLARGHCSPARRTAQTGAFFAVAKADAMARSGDFSSATLLMGQALAAFQLNEYSAMNAGDETSLMAACIQFWLNPQKGAPFLSSQWRLVVAMAPSPRRSWFVWMVILAKLARNDPRDVPEASAELRRLLWAAGTMDEAVRTSLVRSLSGTVSSSNQKASEHWLETLREFPGGALDGEKQLAVAVAAWRRCQNCSWDEAAFPLALEMQAAADPANVPLALIAAYAQINIGAPEKAAGLLSKTAEVGPSGWLALVAEGISGQDHGVASAQVGSMSLNLASATGLLLQAVGMFRNNERERGFEAVLSAWRLCPASVPGIFRVSQWVTVICAASAGNAPPHLLGAVKDLGRAAVSSLELDRLAHCAAVLSNQTLALDLWRRAVNDSKYDWSDFSRYLCHLASLDAKSGRRQQSVELVREAATYLPAASPEEVTA
jgi:hypothetical protein